MNKSLIIIFTSLFISLTTFAESFVEFIIADVSWPETKWGHVSLRVVHEDKDLVFDFGRYGAMWGFFDTEGAPILRVWKNAAQAHLNYLKKGGGPVTEIRFAADADSAERILAFYDRLTKGHKPYSTSPQKDYYDTKTPAFHSINHNCTTVAIEAFNEGFPQYNVNNLKYAVAVNLSGIFRMAANDYAYDNKNSRWKHIWWPMDLRALLEKEYVNKGAIQRNHQQKPVSKNKPPQKSSESTYY